MVPGDSCTYVKGVLVSPLSSIETDLLNPSKVTSPPRTSYPYSSCISLYPILWLSRKGCYVYTDSPSRATYARHLSKKCSVPWVRWTYLPFLPWILSKNSVLLDRQRGSAKTIRHDFSNRKSRTQCPGDFPKFVYWWDFSETTHLSVSYLTSLLISTSVRVPNSLPSSLYVPGLVSIPRTPTSTFLW